MAVYLSVSMNHPYSQSPFFKIYSYLLRDKMTAGESFFQIPPDHSGLIPTPVKEMCGQRRLQFRRDLYRITWPMRYA